MMEEGRMTFWGIALCNLKRRPFRTACLVTLVAALAFVLFSGSQITGSASNGVDGLSKRLGADILIVPKGYDQKLEGILLRGEPSAFYLDASWIEKIAGIEGIEAVSPQLFVASLNSYCCSVPLQLIGYEQSTDFIVEPWIKTALPKALADDEIVIGGLISGRTGDKITFFGREYRIAAKMGNTGTGFDASVFMNMDAARVAASDCAEKTGAAPPPDGSVSSLAVIVAEGFTASGVTGRINNEFDYGNSGVVPVAAKKIVDGVSGGLRALTGFFGALSAILWAVSLLVLCIAFSVMSNERKREFGILRSLGFTRKRLAALVLLESGAISLAGGAIGILLSAVMLLPFQTYIGEAVNMPYMQPTPAQFAATAAFALLLSFVTGPLASLPPAVKIGRSDAYTAIREGGL
ncbi:MAG: FtsX-like permease family protein [Clostridiales Family XIII bacterium]|jgi:putative ABC transport system permease protein|nr:FtsX-like permease family protein [Clostridiales Family XIII bacterium]